MKTAEPVNLDGSKHIATRDQEFSTDKVMEIHKRFPLLIYVGSAISILLVIMIGALSLYFSQQQKDKEQWVEHTYKLLGNTEILRQNLCQMAISKHGYSTTGALLFLNQYQSSSIALSSGLKNLNSLAKDNPAEMSRIISIRHQIGDLLGFWDSVNPWYAVLSKHEQVQRTLVEKSKLDVIGAAIVGITVTERQLLSERENGNRLFRQRMNYFIIAGTLLILCIVSFLIFITLRELKYRIVAYERENAMNRMKSSFVSLASHEFRTPLGSVLLSASLIEKYGSIHGDENILKHANKIKLAVQNLRSIREDFLSLEKLNAGKIEAHTEPFDPVALCEEIEEEMRAALSPGQQFCYKHIGAGKMVALDKNLLKNAIINLVANAIKYSGENTTISLISELSADRFIVTVKDNGVGIAEEDQKDLFSPFYRINHTGKIPGTGLGLNIVQRYVTLMNGKICFESKPMQGTCFQVRFPV